MEEKNIKEIITNKDKATEENEESRGPEINERFIENEEVIVEEDETANEMKDITN